MAEQTSEEKSSALEEEDKKNNNNEIVDPELFSCLLHPVTSNSDPEYHGTRRLLLYLKAESGVFRRRVHSSIFRYF